MKQERIMIGAIPALVWGEPSEKVYLCVHGKMSSKESAEGIAEIAVRKGYQTISFDLPQHGQRMQDAERCDIWNGVRDLAIVAEYVLPAGRWSICMPAASARFSVCMPTAPVRFKRRCFSHQSWIWST